MAKIQGLGNLSVSTADLTLAFYDENAEQYARQTAQADLSELYARFLPLIPPRGRILDLGCGGGRDLRQFKIRGFDCVGIDPASRLAQIAREHSGCEILVGRAEELRFVDEFDGVWACASLLHLNRANLPVAIRRICKALKVSGVLFLSMQEGTSDSVSTDGRFYARYTAAELKEIVGSGGLTVREQWTTQDTLPGRGEMRWLNMIAVKAAPAAHL